MIPGAMTKEDVVSGENVKPEIVVSAFIFGADQKGDKTDAAANAVEQAKTWANTIKNQ